ncbi:hypothetical protein AB4181_01230 [Vibrio lentus]
MNKYENNFEKILTINSWSKKLTNFNGEPASLDELIWVYQSDNHIKVNLIFADDSKATTNRIKKSNFKTEWELSLEYRKIIALYINKTVNNGVNHAGRVYSIFLSLRCFFSHVKKTIGNLTLNDVDRFYNNSSLRTQHKKDCAAFLRWAISNKLCNPSIKAPSFKDTNDGYDQLYKNQKKKPNEEIIIALSAITNQVIPNNNKKWDVSATTQQRDAFVCTISTLGLSTPTRLASEFITLPKQQLQAVTDEKGNTIHQLGTQGSKGFIGNFTHILSGMSDPVQRVLKYITFATEPGRILARYYNDPSAKLSEIMPIKTREQSSRIDKLNLSVDKPLNLFQLGLIIGFYPLDHSVFVPKLSHENLGKGVSTKLSFLSTLGDHDVITLSEKSSHLLFGCMIKKRDITRIVGKEQSTITIKELQDAWICFFKRNYETFPFMCFASNQTKLDKALFTFTGNQLFFSARASYPGAASFYSIVKGVSLSNIISRELKTMKNHRSIFERHGFASSFSITPHQFRHYLSDYGEKKGIPHRILNLWAGRSSPEHLLHYIHTSEEERSSEIAGIMFKEDLEEKKSIRLLSMAKYQELREQSPHIASTTSVGFCTQDLSIMPCMYMNDFISQCTFCKQACHIAHDTKAIEFLKDDLLFQTRRLEKLLCSSGFPSSAAKKQAYKNHKKNTALLSKLIEVMESTNIPKGAIIRVILDRLEFRISDLQLKTIDTKKFTLRDADSDLKQALSEVVQENHNDSFMDELLDLI